MGQTWDKKSIYHSELVKASGRDGIALMFTGPVRESKYQGKPPYVPFKVYGDSDGEYTLNIENDLVKETVEKAPNDIWLVCRAEGSRDGATMFLADANGNPVFASVPREEIAQPSSPPPLWPDSPNPTPSANGGPVAKAVAMTVEAVGGLREAGFAMDADAISRLYSTHFIQASK